jgi:hypothetical protein
VAGGVSPFGRLDILLAEAGALEREPMRAER